MLGYTTAAVVELQDELQGAHATGSSFSCDCGVPCGAVNGSSSGNVCSTSDLMTTLPGKTVVYIAGAHHV